MQTFGSSSREAVVSLTIFVKPSNFSINCSKLFFTVYADNELPQELWCFTKMRSPNLVVPGLSHPSEFGQDSIYM